MEYVSDVETRPDDEWICTFTGRRFWPLDPRPEDVDIDDIAHALANKCRYTGHTRKFYSVAQHCVIMAQVMPDHNAWGLMHDASEAYLPDVARPVKHRMRVYGETDEQPWMAHFREIEDDLLRAVADRFGLPRRVPHIVHEYDRILLATERRDLMRSPPGRAWSRYGGDTTPLRQTITPWTPDQAEEAFHIMFNRFFN